MPRPRVRTGACKSRERQQRPDRCAVGGVWRERSDKVRSPINLAARDVGASGISSAGIGAGGVVGAGHRVGLVAGGGTGVPISGTMVWPMDDGVLAGTCGVWAMGMVLLGTGVWAMGMVLLGPAAWAMGMVLLGTALAMGMVLLGPRCLGHGHGLVGTGAWAMGMVLLGTRAWAMGMVLFGTGVLGHGHGLVPGPVLGPWEPSSKAARPAPWASAFRKCGAIAAAETQRLNATAPARGCFKLMGEISSGCNDKRTIEPGSTRLIRSGMVCTPV